MRSKGEGADEDFDHRIAWDNSSDETIPIFITALGSGGGGMGIQLGVKNWCEPDL